MRIRLSINPLLSFKLIVYHGIIIELPYLFRVTIGHDNIELINKFYRNYVWVLHLFGYATFVHREQIYKKQRIASQYDLIKMVDEDGLIKHQHYCVNAVHLYPNNVMVNELLIVPMESKWSPCENTPIISAGIDTHHDVYKSIDINHHTKEYIDKLNEVVIWQQIVRDMKQLLIDDDYDNLYYKLYINSTSAVNDELCRAIRLGLHYDYKEC